MIFSLFRDRRRHSWIFCAALWVIGAGCFVPGATAQTTPPVPEQHEVNTEHRFRLGLSLVAADRPREAAKVFSDILARDPNLDRVRLELARAWFLSEQWGKARSEFLSVLSGRLPEPVRDNVLGFLRAIDARRGVDWDVDFALVRLGNTRRYESDTIMVNGLPFTLNGRDGETALGLRYRLGGVVKQGFPGLSGSNVQALGFGGFSLSGEEGPGSRFDDLTVRGEAGIRFVWPRATLSFSPSVSRQFLAGTATEDRLGFQAEARIRSRQGAAYAIRVGWQDIDHLRSDGRDGHVATLGLSGTWSLTPRASLGLSLSLVDREAAISLADNHRLARLTASGTFGVGRGITLRPSLYFEHKKVDKSGPAAADETGTGVSLTIETSRLVLGNGFTPYATLSASQVKSDIKAFSWRTHSVALGLERRF